MGVKRAFRGRVQLGKAVRAESASIGPGGSGYRERDGSNWEVPNFVKSDVR
jgi:hypothetical protein